MGGEREQWSMSHIAVQITDRPAAVGGTFRLQRKQGGNIQFNITVTTNPTTGTGDFVSGGVSNAILHVTTANYNTLFTCALPYDADLEYNGPAPPVPGTHYPVLSYTHCVGTPNAATIGFPPG